MLRKTPLALLVCAAMLLGITFTFAGKTKNPNADKPRDTESLVGEVAPDFSAETIDGGKVSLAAEKGNVVLMDFWATWCPPCVESLPHIQELATNSSLTSKGLKVWAVDVNVNGESKEKAAAFVKKNNYTFTVPFDASNLAASKYLVNGIPTTVLVGRDGTIKKVWVGMTPPEQMKKAIEQQLSEGAPAKTS